MTCPQQKTNSYKANEHYGYRHGHEVVSLGNFQT